MKQERFDNGVIRPHLGIYDEYCGPHCDTRILHEPGTCSSCDGFPIYQKAREIWGIAFTRTNPNVPAPVNLLPDPAECARSLDSLNSWGGNIATKDPYMSEIAQMIVGATDPEEIEQAIDRLRAVKKELEGGE